MKTTACLIGVLIGAFCALGWTGYARSQNAGRQAWEYKALLSATKEFQGDKTFNELGAQGWELVAASGSSDSYGIYFVFKRPK